MAETSHIPALPKFLARLSDAERGATLGRLGGVHVVIVTDGVARGSGGAVHASATAQAEAVMRWREFLAAAWHSRPRHFARHATTQWRNSRARALFYTNMAARRRAAGITPV
jgi:hypothetical protein